MRTLNIHEFLASHGMAVLAGTYSETISGALKTVTIMGSPTRLSNTECVQYTFRLFRMPGHKGVFHEFLSCYETKPVKRTTTLSD